MSPGCTRHEFFRWLWVLAVNLLFAGEIPAQNFVGTSGPNLVLNGRSFFFSGANNYYLIYESDFMVNNVLTNAVAMNLKVIRAWGFIDGASKNGFVTQPALGVYDPSGFERIDYFVSRARQLGLKLIIPFVNNWDDFGGMDWYVSQAEPGGGVHEDFYTNTVIKAAYKNFIHYFLTRTNQYTGACYLNEPAVLAWELANEPRSTDGTCATLTNWAGEMSSYLKGLDTNHLVCVGDEGFYHQPTNSDWTMNGSQGVDWLRLLQLPGIDFGTLHLYPDSWGETSNWSANWIAQHIHDSHALGKPVVLEEYGFLNQTERDGIYSQWTQIVTTNGGNGDVVWMLAGLQDDGTLYPDYDGFELYNPGSTTAILAAHAASMLAESGLAPLPWLAIAGASVKPATGVTNLCFPVYLSSPATNPVTASYTTSDGTAVAGLDYVATNGVLAFAPGTITNIISVTVLGGSIAPGQRTFTVSLVNASNAAVSSATATGTIIGPTPARPPAGVSIGYMVNSDWGAAANVTFTLTNNTGTAINNWTLAFDFASVISPYSGAVVLSRVGSYQVLTNLSYGLIPTNGTFSFQCEATPGDLGTNQPANYLFNGAALVASAPPRPLLSLVAIPVQIQLFGQTGESYVIQTSSDLVNWTPVATNQLTGTPWNWTDSLATLPTRRFYRAVWLP